MSLKTHRVTLSGQRSMLDLDLLRELGNQAVLGMLRRELQHLNHRMGSILVWSKNSSVLRYQHQSDRL
jgi:hypothetical protein